MRGHTREGGDTMGVKDLFKKALEVLPVEIEFGEQKGDTSENQSTQIPSMAPPNSTRIPQTDAGNRFPPEPVMVRGSMDLVNTAVRETTSGNSGVEAEFSRVLQEEAEKAGVGKNFRAFLKAMERLRQWVPGDNLIPAALGSLEEQGVTRDSVKTSAQELVDFVTRTSNQNLDRFDQNLKDRISAAQMSQQNTAQLVKELETRLAQARQTEQELNSSVEQAQQEAAVRKAGLRGAAESYLAEINRYSGRL
jgi:hypothetical protein